MRTMRGPVGRWGPVLVVGLWASCGGLSCHDAAEWSAPAARDAAACGILPEEGCPCTGERTVECRLDPVERDGGLYCRTGEQRCRGGVWGPCESIVETPAPDAEVGRAVAALVSGPEQCSACQPDCFTHTDQPGPEDLPGRSSGLVYDSDAGGVRLEEETTSCTTDACRTTYSHGDGGDPWMPTPDNSGGVVVDPADGALTLGFTSSRVHGVWIANMNGATVSRFDPEGREVARYPSARPDALNRARPWDEPCNWRDRGNCPSRTAVDQNFDAYVANRAFGNQPTVTKYAASLEGCVDRNGDGIIQTSRDLNGNGVIDMGTAEFVGVDDECLLWTVPVGGRNGVARALAVGVAPSSTEVGDLWVGNFNERRAYRLSPRTGATLGSVSIAPITPYGAAAGPDGRIWFTGGRLGSVDPATMAFTLASPPPTGTWPYGIAIWTNPDRTQTYVYTAEWGGHGMRRYDPATNTWFRRSFSPWWPNQRFYTGGLGADEGRVWASLYGFYKKERYRVRRWRCRWVRERVRWRWGWRWRWRRRCGWVWSWRSRWRWYGSCSFLSFRIPNIDDPRVYSPPGCPAHHYHGVGVGFDGAIWAVGLGSNNVVRLSPDRSSYYVSPRVLKTPYTYSDFIGYGLHTFANPRGHYRFVVDSECEGHDWTRLEWNAETPPGTSVSARVRASDTLTGLAAATWVGPFTSSPADLTAAPGPVPPGRYLQVELVLETADRSATPRVHSVSATGGCDRTMYVPSGHYTQTYESACTGGPAGSRPVWGDLDFDVETPAGTRIDWEIRGADDVAGLAGATPVTVSTPPTTSPVNIDGLLLASGAPRNPLVLSVTANLYASADGTASPVLYSFSVEYTCVAAE